MSFLVEAATAVESKEHATTVGRSLTASQCADARVTVVIPCYEQARYLPDAIASLVAQEFTDWQATIINDGSSDNTVEVAEALIVAYPDRRISLINQPNSGPSVARNVAIAGTKSEFILPLDADDKIAPSMLGKCVQLLDARNDLAIAYCDWQYFGAQSHVRQALDYDIETLCHRENLFTLTSLFRRSAWVAVGGFNQNMRLGLEDWDFWVACAEKGFHGQRIPEVLFFYRAKEGGRNTSAQPHLRHMYAQIVLNHPALYPPSAVANAQAVIAGAVAQSDAARCLQRALEELARGDQGSALASLKQALSLSKEPAIAREANRIVESIRPRSVSAPTGTSDDPNVAELREALRWYRAEPRHSGHAQRLGRCFGHLLRMQEVAARRNLNPLHQPTVQKLFGLWFEARAGLDSWLVDQLPPMVATEDLFGFALLCARTAPWELPAFRPVAEFPLALQIPYVKYLLGLRETTSTAADHKRMVIHVSRVGEELLRFLEASERTTNYGEILSAVASSLNFIPLYVSGENLLPAYRARAAILERFAALVGTALDCNFSRRPLLPGARFKVGFLSHHLGSQTETHVSLSNLRLDRNKFEIHAFVLTSASSSIESFAREQCDSFTVLSGSIGQKVAALRGAQLDAVIIGTNVTAVTNDTSLLAAHRLARVQILSYCSPTSSGFGSVDYFLVGSHALFPGAEQHFSEKLLVMQGPPGCLDYSCEPEGTLTVDRSNYGLGPDDLVFVNAASCFKITAEALDAWMSLLAEVPHSKLMLMPFNPNWSSNFPRVAFSESIDRACRRHGIARERVVVIEGLACRADVKAVQRLADLYLDVFPFSGSLSVIDPLELGLPVVACAGETFRGNFAPAILRALGLDRLVASDPTAYRELALRLARDPAFRAQISTELRSRMAGVHAVTQPEVYGRELTRVLQECLSNP